MRSFALNQWIIYTYALNTEFYGFFVGGGGGGGINHRHRVCSTLSLGGSGR